MSSKFFNRFGDGSNFVPPINLNIFLLEDKTNFLEPVLSKICEQHVRGNKQERKVRVWKHEGQTSSQIVNGRTNQKFLTSFPHKISRKDTTKQRENMYLKGEL